MRDVILVRSRQGRAQADRQAQPQFKADIGVPTQTGVVTSKRGWTWSRAR